MISRERWRIEVGWEIADFGNAPALASPKFMKHFPYVLYLHTV